VIYAALTGLVVVALYVWQFGVQPCQDGARYTSGKPQPSPFHRRFHAWPPRVLMVVTWVSFIALAAMMGTWQRALLFATLPGVWMCCVMPTTVDGPALAMATASTVLYPTSPVAAVFLSIVGGAIHERAPVFAALFAWSPWPLLGLLAVQWWAKRAAPNHASADLADRLVGHDFIGTVLAHKPHVQFFGEGGLVWAMRGVVPLAAWLGAPVQAWAALGVAFASRVIATDTARSLMWAAPPLLMKLDVPEWAVALHVMSFRPVMR
jgi:hypothetical protein